ncbi:MAG: VWA domain-containing protein [Deltaproteobacteria bacterium]|nr:VWA domain-containing protein [Deltaproteobacteria bacterium]
MSLAVHLLIDTSGSMNSQIEQASLTAYSLCDALAGVPGINVAATAFPGGQLRNTGRGVDHWATVSPLLKHGQAMHRRFQLFAAGTTPLAQALWWVIQDMVPLSESRKVIFIVTDGVPDSDEEAMAAIREGRNLGLEIYGLGLGTDSVKNLLPGRSVIISNFLELPQKLFWLLGQVLTVTITN